ncbi:hypothetical protein EVA_16393 [gut metagenome]|uniref:Uncharacterized protein n=1 Tax=gut metagenome TaxID=749906 RepID=J9FKT0_9ZZZZ
MGWLQCNSSFRIRLIYQQPINSTPPPLLYRVRMAVC